MTYPPIPAALEVETDPMRTGRGSWTSYSCLNDGAALLLGVSGAHFSPGLGTQGWLPVTCRVPAISPLHLQKILLRPKTTSELMWTLTLVCIQAIKREDSHI